MRVPGLVDSVCFREYARIDTSLAYVHRAEEPINKNKNTTEGTRQEHDKKK